MTFTPVHPLDLFAVTEAPPPKPTDEKREATEAVIAAARTLSRDTSSKPRREALPDYVRRGIAGLEGALARLDGARR